MATNKTVSVRVGNGRLLKLAGFLSKLPRRRFDYRVWVGTDWGGAPDLSCGTKACALGWATAMPTFRRLGLRLKPLKRTPQYSILYDNGGVVTLKNQRRSPTRAAAAIFGITEAEATFLFTPFASHAGQLAPSGEATPKAVAQHIRRFVAGRA